MWPLHPLFTRLSFAPCIYCSRILLQAVASLTYRLSVKNHLLEDRLINYIVCTEALASRVVHQVQRALTRGALPSSCSLGQTLTPLFKTRRQAPCSPSFSPFPASSFPSCSCSCSCSWSCSRSCSCSCSCPCLCSCSCSCCCCCSCSAAAPAPAPAHRLLSSRRNSSQSDQTGNSFLLLDRTCRKHVGIPEGF